MPARAIRLFYELEMLCTVDVPRGVRIHKYVHSIIQNARYGAGHLVLLASWHSWQ